MFDSDGHFLGYIVLQWQPHAKQWCHSDGHARGNALRVDDFQYLGPCPIGPDGDQQKQLASILSKLKAVRGQSENMLDDSEWELLNDTLASLIVLRQ